MILFAVPARTGAAEIRQTYEDYQKTILYKPSEETIQTAIQSSRKKNLAAYPCAYPTQCVCYVKQLVGDYSSWGDGGWKLSDNSGPMVGVAIIFNYTHIGYVKAFDGYNIGYTHQIAGKIYSMSWTTIDDPTIWKFHSFAL